MKIKEGFVLREVAGDTVVLPTGDLNINAMITLNESAAFLWKLMEVETTEEEVVKAVLAKYDDTDEEMAAKAVKGFVYAPNENGEGGVVVTYKLEISVDGKEWTPLGGERMFDNIVNNPVAQDVAFDTPVQARMIRLTPVRVEANTGAAPAASETYGVSEFKGII